MSHPGGQFCLQRKQCNQQSQQHKQYKQRGMTLIEVMVALAVFSIAMLAVLDASSQSLRSQGYLEQRTLAAWVAENQMVQSHLETLKAGNSKGQQEMAGQTWYWSRQVQKTVYPALLRVDIEVRSKSDGEPVALLTSFVGSQS